MYSLIDKLIFPAPFPSYDYKSLEGKLIFIPKFEKQQQIKVKKDNEIKNNE